MSLLYKLRGKGLGRLPGAQWLYRYLNTIKKKDLIVPVLDFAMATSTSDIGDLTPSLRHRGVYDPVMTSTVLGLVEEDMYCVDIGANIGYFTLLLSKLVGEEGYVRAYEPETKNYDLLLKNLALNKVSNVTPIQEGVYSRASSKLLYVSKGYYGSHSLRRGTNKEPLGLDIELVELDSLDSQMGNQKVDFVKVDVQGAEMEVLQGMSNVIDKNPYIIMIWEYLPLGLKRFDCEPIDFLRKLKEYGFSFWDLDEKKKSRIPIDTEELVKKYSKRTKSTNILVGR